MRADDRCRGVLVNSVRFADLDLFEAGVLECHTELRLGEGPGNAAGPGGHFRSGRFVHVGVGDHV